jgi:hypothetical protein
LRKATRWLPHAAQNLTKRRIRPDSPHVSDALTMPQLPWHRSATEECLTSVGRPAPTTTPCSATQTETSQVSSLPLPPIRWHRTRAVQLTATSSGHDVAVAPSPRDQPQTAHRHDRQMVAESQSERIMVRGSGRAIKIRKRPCRHRAGCRPTATHGMRRHAGALTVTRPGSSVMSMLSVRWPELLAELPALRGRQIGECRQPRSRVTAEVGNLAHRRYGR